MGAPARCAGAERRSGAARAAAGGAVSQLLALLGLPVPPQRAAPGLSGEAAPRAQLLEELYSSRWALLGLPVPPGWAAQRAALWG